jgi:proteasome lid subunit RPN8/RPN11
LSQMAEVQRRGSPDDNLLGVDSREYQVALNVTGQQLKAMRRHAEKDYPKESCGLMLGIRNGNSREVVDVVPCENASFSPRTRYEIDVRELVGVQRKGRGRGLEIVGIYHSHPEHEAKWSATDLRDAEWVGCSYLIMEVRDGVVKAQGSFELVSEGGGKKFVDEELRVALD